MKAKLPPGHFAHLSVIALLGYKQFQNTHNSRMKSVLFN